MSNSRPSTPLLAEVGEGARYEPGHVESRYLQHSSPSIFHGFYRSYYRALDNKNLDGAVNIFGEIGTVNMIYSAMIYCDHDTYHKLIYHPKLSCILRFKQMASEVLNNARKLCFELWTEDEDVIRFYHHMYDLFIVVYRILPDENRNKTRLFTDLSRLYIDTTVDSGDNRHVVTLITRLYETKELKAHFQMDLLGKILKSRDPIVIWHLPRMEISLQMLYQHLKSDFCHHIRAEDGIGVKWLSLTQRGMWDTEGVLIDLLGKNLTKYMMSYI